MTYDSILVRKGGSSLHLTFYLLLHVEVNFIKHIQKDVEYKDENCLDSSYENDLWVCPFA